MNNNRDWIDGQPWNPLRWARWLTQELIGIILVPKPEPELPSPRVVIAKQLDEAEREFIVAKLECVRWTHTQNMLADKVELLQTELTKARTTTNADDGAFLPA